MSAPAAAEPVAKKQKTSEEDLPKPKDGGLRFDWGEKNELKTWKEKTADVLDDDTLKIYGRPVMESWEKAYMHQLADHACVKGGRVLEVGFGLGIASRQIQTHDNVTEHVVIEANADVFKKLEEFAKTAPQKVTPIFGLWQDVIDKLESDSFDGIMFDTYPGSENDLHTHHFSFLPHAYRLLKPGGAYSYCNLTSWGVLKTRDHGDDDTRLFVESQWPHCEKAGFVDYKITIVDVDPPASCEYYHTKTIPAPIMFKPATSAEAGN